MSSRMANKRVLTAEDVKDSCAKRRKISRDININSPLPQVDGRTDSADEKKFKFAPNITQNLNISHSCYAPTGHINTFLNGHFAPKITLDGRNFMPPIHFGSFMPEFGLQERLTGMSSKDDSFTDLNELSSQGMTQTPDVFKRSTQQGFINSANGAFPKMIYPNCLNATDHKIFPKNAELPTPINEFNAVGGSIPMLNGSTYYNSFLDKRKEFTGVLNQPEMTNPQNPIMFNDYRNFNPSFNNGMKSFPINHFPYFRLPNIPNGSNFQDSFSQSKPFNPFLPLMTNNQLSRSCAPFPNSTHHWNTGLEKNEFPRAELTLDISNSVPKTEYLIHKNNSNVPLPVSSNNPMKMIENFSATHFHNSFPNDSTIKSDERSDRTSHEKCAGKPRQTLSREQDEQRSQDLPVMESATKYFSQLPEKKMKRHKKNGEQLKYESWLYEKRNALQSRLMMLEQEMLSIPSSGSCQELRSHFESAITQLRREGIEHETMIKVFENTKNADSRNNANTSSVNDKPIRPAKCNGASQHLNSNMVPHLGAKNSNHSSTSYQRNNPEDAEPTNTCKQLSREQNYEDLPLPKIVEPSITLQCTADIKGWDIDKPKLIDLKQDIHDGFKPTDALKILNSLPEDNFNKVLRMEDLSRRLTVAGSFETGMNIPEDCSSDHKEFRISSEWLVLNKQCFTMVESCCQCCKIMKRAMFVEEIVVDMGREKVMHGLKYCGENCMKAHQEKRKIWERDKKLHEEFMDKNVDIQASKDLNSTIIYDPNKTLPLDTSKESLHEISDLTISPVKKWRDVKYGTCCKLLHKKNRQKKETILDEKKDSHLLHSVHLPAEITDARSCFLCGGVGDDEGNGPGRLLIVDLDKWVHANCSLWSSNIYEALDGTFIGSKNLCSHECACCKRDGATIMCFLPNCGLKFHLRCALSICVCFLENKVTYCRHHCPKNMLGLMVKDISIKRRVCIERQESQQVAKMLREDEPENFTIRLGNLIVHSIGHLLPQFVHSLKFNTTENIYPVGFKSVRFYWSYRKLHQRCQYICSILEHDGAPVFKIQVEEEDEEEVSFENNNCTGVWMQVISRLDGLRRSNGLSRVFTEYISGEDLFGLNEPTIRRIVESLPGVELLSNCNLKYGKSSIYIPPLAPNPSGCIRSEPKSRTLFKRSHTLLSNFNAGSTVKNAWLGSGEFSINQYMKQFTATKSQRYRSLKTEWRNNVYLRRSNIQGLGLFAGRELEQFTMVIEYIGELIRNEISEIREKIYEQQNRGVYMFRLDENTVIDATMTGGPARYINHCCDPNCFTEVIPTEKGNKIVIIAKRKIQSGEELSYDYKFNLEDEKSKIPCLCGAANCFKWMKSHEISKTSFAKLLIVIHETVLSSHRCSAE